MKSIYFILFGIFHFLLYSETYGQLRNLTVINSVDPNYGDDSDLEAIYEKMELKRIVLLGEKGHGDSLTTDFKKRFVKFLIQKKGFTTLLEERPGSDFYCIQHCQDTGFIQRLDHCITQGWEGYINKIEMDRYFLFNLNIPNYHGIDLGMSTIFLDTLWVKMRAFNINSNISNYKHIKKYIIKSNTQRPSLISYLQSLNSLKKISNLLEKNLKSKNTFENKFWFILFKQFESQAIWERYRLKWRKKNFIKAYAPRDRYLAKILEFYCYELFPNEKIIVSFSNYHISNNLNELEPKEYLENKTMINLSSQRLKNETYSIAFTNLLKSYKKKSKGHGYNVVPLTECSIEHFARNKNENYLFFEAKDIDYSNCEGVLNSNSIISTFKSKDCSKVFDSFIFIRNELESTYIDQRK